MKKRIFWGALALGAVVVVVAVSFYAATLIEDSETLRSLIESFGIFGIVVVGIIGGLNLFIPIPPSSVAPIFLEAGFSIWTIIIGISVGTIMSDSVSYFFGMVGKGYADSKHPKITKWIGRNVERYRPFVLPAALIFIVFAPLPNEVMHSPRTCGL